MLAEAIKIEEQFARQAYDIIIVGTGPAGIRVAQEISRLNNTLCIGIFGDEPWQPYNRVKLSSLLSGDIKEDTLYTSYDVNQYENISTFFNNRITLIDRYTKTVTDIQGKSFSYDKLILATGSHARIPNIPGIHLNNVFTFRDLSDTQSLMSRSVRTQKTVVIGGGLLGLEAAHAMQRFKTEVHIIEHSMWPMFNQLDLRAGRYLTRYIESLGLNIHTNSRIKKLLGDTKVTGIQLDTEEIIECDTVIIAAGISPNNELALKAGLSVGRGIRIDNHLQTRDNNIFAIGECAEHNNQIYGLVAPGLEQAAVLAHYLCGEKTQYRGSTSSTHLKVLDYPVFSVGETGTNARSREEIVYQNHKKEIYRKIVVVNGRIRGAVGIGEWPGVNRFQEAVEKKRRIWPWQINRFKQSGLVWNDATSENVIDWPATATVCNCTGVTKGQLDTAMLRGANNVIKIAHATGASTVCGSCKNLLTDYMGDSAASKPDKPLLVLLISSIISLIFALSIFVLPSISYNHSVIEPWNISSLWTNSLFKQISGFSLLGLSVVISLLSIKKRFNKIITLWDYSYWRLAHIGIGGFMIIVLLAHTGFRFGDNLNLYLMLIFSSLLLAGAISAITISYEHALPHKIAKLIRSYAIWSHIVLLWPLPALLGFHIIKTYYF